MVNMRKKIIFALIVLCFCIVLNITSVEAYSNERITDYDVEIYLDEDATMEVTEEITVYAAGDEIKHGIYRDFPTEYENRKIKFDVEEVLLDGEDVDYSLSSVDRGARIKIGNENTYVSEGFHTYTITYETERQIAFEDDYDELYWNVIGSGWLFSIEHCHATVYFPEGTTFIEDELETYTGEYGNRGETATVYTNILEEENAVDFEIYDELDEGEAFTISIKVDKGTFIEPSIMQKILWFLEDNVISIVILGLLVFLIIWQVLSWKKYGEDPKPNVIIPKYFPPEGMSPADVRYVEKMGTMSRILEASIINLAVKGYFKFTKESEKSKKIIIEKNKEISDLPKLDDNEQRIYDRFNDKEVLEYSSTFQLKLSTLKMRINENLKEKFQDKLFFKNNKEFSKSIVVSIAILIIAIIVGFFVNKFAAGMYLARLYLVVPVTAFLVLPITVFMNVIKMKAKTLFKVFLILIFVIPFLIAMFMMLINSIGSIFEMILSSWAIGALILDNIVFYKLIRRYTEAGLRVKEDIEGFKMFINTAKDDDFEDKTPEMFDKYFPYAYVLGLENKWAAKFEDVLQTANYSPTWCTSYMYHNGVFNAVIFTNAFSSSFSSGMSSASTAPSSAGGSGGGGGFSGGGGGGRRPVAAGNFLIFE